jgi:hypothetical protein
MDASRFFSVTTIRGINVRFQKVLLVFPWFHIVIALVYKCIISV